MRRRKLSPGADRSAKEVRLETIDKWPGVDGLVQEPNNLIAEDDQQEQDDPRPEGPAGESQFSLLFQPELCFGNF